MLARLARQVLVVSAAGLAVGAGLNAASSHGVSLLAPVYPASASATVCNDPAAAPERREHPRMPLDEALAACEACTAGFVDARGAAAFAHGHITGAFHLPPEGFEGRKVLDELRGFDTLVVYDDQANCELAQGVADRLVAAGFRDVRVLDGNWTAWEAVRGPSQAGACEACEHRSALRRPE